MKPTFISAVIALFLLQLISGCTPESDDQKKTKTVFDPQLQALEKAKQVEDVIKKAKQDQDNEIKRQEIQ